MWCWSHQDAVLALLGHGACIVVMWCPCHQDTVLASLGGGVSVSVSVSVSVLLGHGISVFGRRWQWIYGQGGRYEQHTGCTGGKEAPSWPFIHRCKASLTVTLQMSTRCDTICKGEEEQENGKHTNQKSPKTKQWPVGSIYHCLLAHSRVGPI